MSVPDDYLRYPHRQRGLDHPWFPYRPVRSRPKLAWPGGARIALWVTVPVEFFPLNMSTQPFRAIGAIDRAYPDYWTYSNRDYGNRIGLFRIARVLDGFGVKVTAAVNAQIALRYPPLFEEMVKRRWEIMAHGIDMGRLQHGGLSRADESAMIAETLTTLRRASGGAIAGWHSPAHSQSMQTLDLLAEAGLCYVADWVNDDLPYDVTTSLGALCALPLNFEWSDRNILVQHDLTIEDYERQVLDAFHYLNEEAVEHGGRVLSLSVTPWIMGYPHRIGGLARVLDVIMRSGSVWSTTGAELADLFRQQATST